MKSGSLAQRFDFLVRQNFKRFNEFALNISSSCSQLDICCYLFTFHFFVSSQVSRSFCHRPVFHLIGITKIGLFSKKEKGVQTFISLGISNVRNVEKIVFQKAKSMRWGTFSASISFCFFKFQQDSPSPDGSSGDGIPTPPSSGSDVKYRIHQHKTSNQSFHFQRFSFTIAILTFAFWTSWYCACWFNTFSLGASTKCPSYWWPQRQHTDLARRRTRIASKISSKIKCWLFWESSECVRCHVWP